MISGSKALNLIPSMPSRAAQRTQSRPSSGVRIGPRSQPDPGPW